MEQKKLVIYTSEKEYNIIKEDAFKYNKSVSAYLKHIIRGYYDQRE